MTVDAILVIRREHLSTPTASVLKHWDQIADRMRARARTCANPAEWCSAMLRDMRVPGPGSTHTADGIAALVDFVRRHDCARAWLDLVEREHGYLLACARLSADQKRAARREREAADAAQDARERDRANEARTTAEKGA